jgi:hypothetical protein
MEPRILTATALTGGAASAAVAYAAVYWCKAKAKADRLRRRGIKKPYAQCTTT